MNKSLALALSLTTSVFIAGCATANDPKEEAMAMESNANPVIAQAKADLDEVIAAGTQWRIIDKATGKKAVDMKTLLETAEKKAAAGETEEAERIAKQVSDVAEIALEQSKRYAGAMPYYNE